jgi:hypothetical protein
MNNLQAFISRIGPKLVKERALAMLLESFELPGSSWRVFRQGAFRTGAWGSKPSEYGRRAKRAGSFSAKRSFEQATPHRWLVLQVIPLVSVADAEALVPSLRKTFRPNPRSKVTVTEEREIDDQAIPGIGTTWLYEQKMTGVGGAKMEARYVGGNVGNIVLVVVSSGEVGAWPWDELGDVARAQAAKIRTIASRSNTDGS